MGTDSVAYANDKIANPEVREQTRTSAQAMARDNQRGATTVARSGEPPSELHADPIFSSHKAPETGAHAATGDLPGLPGSTPHEFALHNDDSSVASGDARKQSGASSDASASPWRSGALIPGDVDPGDINNNVSRDGLTSGAVGTDGLKTGAASADSDKTSAVSNDSDKTGSLTPEGGFKIGTGSMPGNGDKVGSIDPGNGDKVGSIDPGNGDKIGAIDPGNGDKTGAITPGNGDKTGAVTPGNGDQIGSGASGDGFDSLLNQLGSSSSQSFGTLPNETGPYTVATDVTQIGTLSLENGLGTSDLLSQVS